LHGARVSSHVLVAHLQRGGGVGLGRRPKDLVAGGGDLIFYEWEQEGARGMDVLEDGRKVAVDDVWGQVKSRDINIIFGIQCAIGKGNIQMHA
jgi:hypothetical protein